MVRTKAAFMTLQQQIKNPMCTPASVSPKHNDSMLCIRVAEIEEQLKNSHATPPLEDRLNSIEERLNRIQKPAPVNNSALEQRLEEIEEQVAKFQIPVTSETTGLESRLSELERHLENFKKGRGLGPQHFNIGDPDDDTRTTATAAGAAAANYRIEDDPAPPQEEIDAFHGIIKEETVVSHCLASELQAGSDLPGTCDLLGQKGRVIERFTGICETSGEPVFFMRVSWNLCTHIIDNDQYLLRNAMKIIRLVTGRPSPKAIEVLFFYGSLIADVKVWSSKRAPEGVLWIV